MEKENSDNLLGYDILIAVSESTLNTDLAKCFADAVIQGKDIIKEWKNESGISDPVPETHIFFNPPEIKISGNHDFKVDVVFPFDKDSYIKLYGDEKTAIDGCGMCCTVDIDQIILEKGDVVVSENNTYEITGKNTLLSQSDLAAAYSFLNTSPFNLHHFFLNLNELEYAGNVVFDNMDSGKQWTEDEKQILQKMTEKMFMHFKKSDINIPVGLVSAKNENNQADENDAKLYYTNMRILPYYQGNGILYAMVSNPDGILPEKKVFDIKLDLIDNETSLFVKWDALFDLGLEQIEDNIAAVWDAWIHDKTKVPSAFPLGPKKISTGHLYVAFGLDDPKVSLGMDYEIYFSKDVNETDVLKSTLSFKGEADPKILQHDNIVIQQENRFYVTDGKIREKSSNSKITPEISVPEAWFLSNLEQSSLGGCLFENFNSFYWQAGGINLFANKEMEYKNLSFSECDNCLLMRIQAVINT